MKKNWIVFPLLVGILAMTGCSTPSANETAKTETTATSTVTSQKTEVAVTVTLQKEDEVLEEKKLTVPADSTLMAVMQENFDIKEDNGMITSISGVEQDTKESWFWTYTINDEMVNTGAYETSVHENDKIIFTYSKF